jgi:hypothetical protein
MRTTAESLSFGDHEVLVSVVSLTGTQNTGMADRARGTAANALEATHDTIEAVSRSAVSTIRRLKENGTCPSTLELELGLAFTVGGNVIVAGGEVEASISVHLTYDTASIT